MSPEIRHAAQVLREKLQLPTGYYVKIDEETDNIIVANERVGFCVTSRYVKDHPNEGYLPVVQKNMAHLQQMTDDQDLVRLHTPAEMQKHRRQSTRFDE